LLVILNIGGEREWLSGGEATPEEEAIFFLLIGIGIEPVPIVEVILKVGETVLIECVGLGEVVYIGPLLGELYNAEGRVGDILFIDFKVEPVALTAVKAGAIGCWYGK